MSQRRQNRFSGPTTVFHGRRLPVEGKPVGYAALIDALDLDVPPPRTLCAIGAKHKNMVADGWRIFGPRYAPEASLDGHLTFALKHEGVDLAVLKRAFQVIGPRPIEAIVAASPTGAYARRLWFLCEWLLGERLDLADAKRGSYT
ncbi:MAG: cell filamentation protein Fic, partial [Hyphomicrobiaceae bacterium]|nr:cell filamentation protein Fic [Hyphomicrobiaceae bacterium]